MADARAEMMQPVTPAIANEARRLIRMARHAGLGVIDPASGGPHVSRALVAPDMTGDPVILISTLATHAGALAADPRASLLFGEPGKGDPLAHPRITVHGRAERIDAAHPDYARIRRRFLERQPKARLYIDFPDFSLWRIALEGGALNGGFGRAAILTRAELTEAVSDDIADAELRVASHMNEDHADAIDRIVARSGEATQGWRIATIDRFGFDCMRGDSVVRIDFAESISAGKDYHMAFVGLARAASQDA